MSNIGNSFGNNNYYSNLEKNFIETKKKEHVDEKETNLLDKDAIEGFVSEYNGDTLILSSGNNEEYEISDEVNIASNLGLLAEDNLLGSRLFSGLISDNAFINEDVSNQRYENLFGGQILSADEQIQYLQECGIVPSFDGYNQITSTNENGQEETFFEKVNSDNSKEFLKVIAGEDGKIQIVQTVIPQGATEGTTSAFDQEYLKNMPKTISQNRENIVMNNLYTSLLTATDSNERDSILTQIKEKQLSYGMEGEELKASYQSVIDNLNLLSDNTYNALLEQLDNAQTIEEKEAISSQIGIQKAQLDADLTDFVLDMNALDSKLPEEQINELTDMYQELADVNNSDERDMILAEIKQKQAQFELNDEELALSNEQIMNALYGSYSLEIGELNEQSLQSEDMQIKEEINAQIETLDAKCEYDINQYYCMTQNELNSQLPDEQYSQLKDLYQELADATTEAERSAIRTKISNLQQEFELDEAELKLSNQQVFDSYNVSTLMELAEINAQIPQTVSDEEKNNLYALLNDKSQYRMEVLAEIEQEINVDVE